MAIPTPPPDASGGFLTIQYSNGTDSHRHRMHILPFDKTVFGSGNPTALGSDDDGNHNYGYVGPRSAGFELAVNDTFAAYMNVFKLLIGTAWTARLLSLHQIVDGEPVEVFPTPTPTPVVGTGTGADPTGQFRAFEVLYNFKSSFGGRGRVTVIAPNAQNIEPVEIVLPGSGGDGVRDTGLVAYLSGDPTGCVCHDNHKFQPLARKTTGFNRRLRRHYGFA